MMTRPAPLLYVPGALIGLFLIGPSVIVAIMSFSSSVGLQFPPPGLSLRWYETFFSTPQWTDSAKTSFLVGLGSAGLSTVLGTMTAIGLVRSRLPASAAVNAFVISPVLVPHVVTAIGIYFLFVTYRIIGTYTGLILAHAVLSLPFVVLNVASGLQQVDPDLELAAQGLGARPAEAFLRVTLPLIVPGVIAGAIIAFVISWDELIVALFINSPSVRTLPVVMWAESFSRSDPTIASVATMLTVVTFALSPLALLSRRLGGRR